MLRLWPAGRALVGVLLVLSFTVGLFAPPSIVSAATATIPPGPLPVGELKPVELSFLTIDASISAAGDGVAVEARTRARLKNPDKKQSFERQVTFSEPVPADARIGGQPVASTAPWTVQLAPERDAVIEGTQSLRTGGPVTELQYDWAALKGWGRPGALRLTLHLPRDFDSSQLLLVEPAPAERDALRLSWSYEKALPAGKVRVRFISPSYWRTLAAARGKVGGTQASVADCLALASALRPLADAEGMPADRAAAYQAELLASLRQAVAAGPKDARAHQELAAYLRLRAAGDPRLLGEAVAEYKTAYDLAPGEEVKGHLLVTVDELVAACRKAGDVQGALAALDSVRSLDPAHAAEQAAAYADLAVAQLEAGQIDQAEATIVVGFGAAALERYALHRPHFSALTGEVETGLNGRTLRFTLVPAPRTREAAQRDVAALVEAMSRVEGCQVRSSDSADGILVEILIGSDGVQTLQNTGLALAGALPAEADPALALVAAAAGPARIELEWLRGQRDDRLTYAEDVDLRPAQKNLERRLEQLKWARSEAEAKSDDPIEAARRRWALALLKHYEAGWQALARGTRVSYRLRLPEDIVAPQWAVAWNEERSLGWGVTVPRPERLRPYFIGLGAGVLGVFAVAYVASRLISRRT